MRKATTCLSAALTLMLTTQLVPSAAIAENMNTKAQARERMERVQPDAGVGSSAEDVVFQDWDLCQFAFKSDLQTKFDTLGYHKNGSSYKADDDGSHGLEEYANDRAQQKVYFGKDSDGNRMPWYICGTDSEHRDNLVLFASRSIVDPMKFSDNGKLWGNQAGQMSQDLSVDDPTNTNNEFTIETDPATGKKYYPRNFYKKSDVRQKLIEVAEPEAGLFSQQETDLMLRTEVRTLDRKALQDYEQPEGRVDENFEWSAEKYRYLSGPWSVSNGIDENQQVVKSIVYATPSALPEGLKESDLYYTTNDKLYLPYAQNEYPILTVGSAGDTRVGGRFVNGNGLNFPYDGGALALGQSVLETSVHDDQTHTTPAGANPLFFVRSPWTAYWGVDTTTSAQNHVVYRDVPMAAGKITNTAGGTNNLYDGQWGVIKVASEISNAEFGVQPAMQLDTDNVLFGSMANVAAYGDKKGDEIGEKGAEIGIDEDGIQTLRMDADLGEVKRVATDEDTVIKARADQDDVYLVVQAVDGTAHDAKGSDGGHSDRIAMTTDDSGDPGVLETDIAGAWAMKLPAHTDVTVTADQVTINGKQLDSFDMHDEWEPDHDGYERELRVWLERTPGDEAANITYAELETTEAYDEIDVTNQLNGRAAADGEFAFDLCVKATDGSGQPAIVASGTSAKAEEGAAQSVDFDGSLDGVQKRTLRFDKQSLEQASTAGYAKKLNFYDDWDFPSCADTAVDNIYIFDFVARERIDNLPIGVEAEQAGGQVSADGAYLEIPVALVVEESYDGGLRAPRIIAGKSVSELTNNGTRYDGLYVDENDNPFDEIETAAFVNTYTPPADIALAIKKVDGGTAEKKPLAGAKFTVYTDTDHNNAFDKNVDKPAELADKPLADQKHETLAWPQATNEAGLIEMHGFVPDAKENDGDYFIVENEAPAGYQVLGEPIHIRVSYDKTNSQQGVVVRVLSNDATEPVPSENGIPTMTVENNKVIVLPNSGSAGRLAVVGAGCALIALAVAAVVFDMRRAGRNI